MGRWKKDRSDNEKRVELLLSFARNKVIIMRILITIECILNMEYAETIINSGD